jgi:hypothetical protein
MIPIKADDTPVDERIVHLINAILHNIDLLWVKLDNIEKQLKELKCTT